MHGRPAGSAENDSAAAFLVRRYVALGIPAAFGSGYEQSVAVRSTAYPGISIGRALLTHNVVALLRGSDAALQNEVIVLGAHFDHIGTWGALAEDVGPARDFPHPGADDNASGTALVLELARRFAAHPIRRSLLFAHFSAEELGDIGSAMLVEHPPVPLDSVDVMLNFDMVGRLRDALTIYTFAGADALRAVADSASAAAKVPIDFYRRGPSNSDHWSFAQRGVPAMELYTGMHIDYHRVTDTPAKINVAGMVHIADLAEQMIRAIDGQAMLARR